MQKSPLPLALILFAGYGVAARGQAVRTPTDTDRRASAAAAPLVILDSTRERDGLKGPVRRVETEVARVELNRGETVQKSRSVLERTRYDERGRRVENETYPVIGDPAGEEMHRYDGRGNLAETVVRGARGATLSRTVYEYEFDRFGNWVKMTASLAVSNSGKVGFEPVEITNRTITYYSVDEPRDAQADVKIGAKAPVELAGVAESTPAAGEAATRGGLRRGAHAVVIASHRTPRAALSGGREINFGVLNDRATSLPAPAPAPTWKRLEKPATIPVEVVVDQTGRVVEARAEGGTKALQRAAEGAARRATFFPFYEEGRPVRARGWLNYGFLFSP